MKQGKTYTRRNVLCRAGGVSIICAVGGLGAACSDEAKVAVCADPDDWGAGEAGMRRANAYVDVSPYANKSCQICAFFTADSVPPCGHCDIFEGLANSGGHCNSWSERSS